MEPSEIPSQGDVSPQRSPVPLGPTSPDRITVAGSIYHQPAEGEPVQVSLTSERQLKTVEQVFQRRLKVGNTWQPLIPERCWLQDEAVGMIIVRNEEGRHTRVQPGPEEKATAGGKILEIGFRVDDNSIPIVFGPSVLLVYSKECQPLTVSRPDLLCIRSRAGEIHYTVFVFPR